MFTDNGPAAATNALQDYLIFNMANIPEEAQAKLLLIARERLPVDTIIKGCETLYAALMQCLTMPKPEDGWNALGQAATHLANSNYAGKGARGFELATYAGYRANGSEGEQPPVPELDDDFRIVPKPPEELKGMAMLAAEPAASQPAIPDPARNPPDVGEPEPNITEVPPRETPPDTPADGGWTA